MTCRIGPSTAVYGVTGYPLSHTYSPAIHNFLFERYGIDAVYLAFPSIPARFHAKMKALQEIGISGLNITIPYKKDVMRHCSSIDSTARQIGSVNTVKLESGRWQGSVTDPEGFTRAVLSAFKGFSFKGKRVLMLGAGGSARSVAHACLSAGVNELVVMNRTVSRAVELAKALRRCGFPGMKGVGFDGNLLEKDNAFDLIVNCTSVGLGKGDGCVLDLGSARKKTHVFDLIYNPALTPLLASAKKRGLRHANGLGMLIYQAFASFEIWTGIQPTGKDARDLMMRLGR